MSGDNDVTAKDLRRLSNDEIESLGGEEGVREIKKQVGGGKSDFFVRKGTKEIYNQPKGRRGAPPQYVMDLP